MKRLPASLAVMIAIVPLIAIWTNLTQDLTALGLGAGMMVAVLGAGALARARRATDGIVLLVQALMLVAFTALVSASVNARWPDVLWDGLVHLRTTRAPVAPDPGMTVLLCLTFGLLALGADLLTITLERPSLVIIPLLIMLLVPAITVTDHAFPVLGLAWFAAGLALIFFTTRTGLDNRPRTRVGVVALASALTAASFGVTVAVAPVVPVPAPQSGRGQPILMGEISGRLKELIMHGDHHVALTYQTDRNEGTYLRLYSMPTFNESGWRLTESTVKTGLFTRPPGLVTGKRQHTKVTVSGFNSEYLPVPYAPVGHDAGPHWGYIAESLTVIALAIPDRNSATGGLTYTVDSLTPRPTPSDMAKVPLGAMPPDATTTASVPENIPAGIVNLTHRLTRDKPTAGEKLAALQSYLSGPDFKYVLDSPPGNDYATLEAFLLSNRSGFCVQYASSLALMARIAGIPSRVAIGFLPGTQGADGVTWTVQMRDMHAWAEVYVDGWGWVPIEATPSRQTEPSSPPSSPPPTSPSPAPTVALPETPTTTPGSEQPAPWWVLFVVIVVAGLSMPALLRRRARARRLAAGHTARDAALFAWDEVRATAIDYGVPWPEASPRHVVARLSAPWMTDATRSSLTALAVAAEVARYASTGTEIPAGDWTAATSGFASEASAHATRRQKVTAKVWPASVARRRHRTS